MRYVSPPNPAAVNTDETDEEYLAGRRQRRGLDAGSDAFKLYGRESYVMSRAEALRYVGPVLYAMRLPQGEIKFGWTSDLGRRLIELKGELLAFKPGNRQDEMLLHHGLNASVQHGREYYRETPEVLDLVNSWRSDLGLPPT